MHCAPTADFNIFADADVSALHTLKLCVRTFFSCHSNAFSIERIWVYVEFLTMCLGVSLDEECATNTIAFAKTPKKTNYTSDEIHKQNGLFATAFAATLHTFSELAMCFLSRKIRKLYRCRFVY